MADTAKQLPLKREYFILALIVAVAILLRMTFLHEPFERDEGWYATIAQEILHGGIPYRDAIDQKPPGVFYLYAIAMATFGHTTEAIRIFTALYSSLTLLAVYWLARSLSGAVAGLCAGGVMALFFCAPLLQASSSNSEVFMVLPLVLSACFFVKGYHRQDRRFLLVSGTFAALAMLIKTVALPYVALLYLCAIFFDREGLSLKRVLLSLGALLLPAFSLAIITLGYFQLNGALADFLHWNITVPFKYSKSGLGVTGPTLGSSLQFLGAELILPALLAVTTALWLLVRNRTLPNVYVALLLPASCVAVLMPGMNYPHYFIQLMPFFAVLAGIGLAALFQRKGVLLWISLPVIAGLFSYYVYTDYKYYLVYPPDVVSQDKYGPTFANSVYIARYIKEHTEPSDYIFQWGFEPELYFLSGRRTPVPFISSTIINNMSSPTRAIEHMIASLEQKKPKYILVQPKWSQWPGEAQILRYIALNYKYEATLYYALIFRRNGT
jgi:4-amino-4-deoxy-L-arabinose transferase-like glycosyltransferase